MKIKYTIQNQKYGSIHSFEPIFIRDQLVVRFENATDGMTAKIVSHAPYFCSIKDGVCQFPKEALSGKIGVCVISPDGTIPCTGLIAIKDESGGLTIVPDATEILDRLENTEKEISRLITVQKKLSEKYDDLYQRIKKLFEGYNI
jgi:hypothetical protein